MCRALYSSLTAGSGAAHEGAASGPAVNPMIMMSRRAATLIRCRPGRPSALVFVFALTIPAIRWSPTRTGPDSPVQAAEPYTEKVPGTTISLEMMPVPAGTVQMAAGRQRVDAFWIMRTELVWQAYDVYVFGLDRPQQNGPADAMARPSKPYVLPGDQFGHTGHPALGMTYEAARQFAAWISAKTGKTYRLPTEAEWERACRASDDAAATPDNAWFRDNAGARTHKVATRPANALGITDLLGNAAEWVTAADGPVAKGGAWNSALQDVSCAARLEQTPAWNATDPNDPKSSWWLSDAPFVGIRLVRVTE
jgi:formylglycine-generating enzyme required for sulfatase activity